MEKDKRLDLRDCGTWVWPAAALASAYVSTVLFVMHDQMVLVPAPAAGATLSAAPATEHQKYPWAQAASVFVAAATAAVQVAAMGDGRTTLRAHRDLRAGAVLFVVVWNLWMHVVSTWKERVALLEGHAGEALSLVLAGVGFACTWLLRDDFFAARHGPVRDPAEDRGPVGDQNPSQLTAEERAVNEGVAGSRARAAGAVAATAAGFWLPLHTSATLTGPELWFRYAAFTPLFFVELVGAVLDGYRPVDWVFQTCVTVWVLGVSPAAFAVWPASLAVAARHALNAYRADAAAAHAGPALGAAAAPDKVATLSTSVRRSVRPETAEPSWAPPAPAATSSAPTARAVQQQQQPRAPAPAAPSESVLARASASRARFLFAAPAPAPAQPKQDAIELFDVERGPSPPPVPAYAAPAAGAAAAPQEEEPIELGV